MPLPAPYARLDGLIDIIVDELLREIESADSEAVAQPDAIDRAEPASTSSEAH